MLYTTVYLACRFLWATFTLYVPNFPGPRYSYWVLAWKPTSMWRHFHHWKPSKSYWFSVCFSIYLFLGPFREIVIRWILPCYRCHFRSQTQSLLGKFIESLTFSARLWYKSLSLSLSLSLKFDLLLTHLSHIFISGYCLLCPVLRKNLLEHSLRGKYWDQRM